jgi:hypothetical protein
MSPEEIKPTIPTSKRPQIHTLERAAPDLSLFTFMCNLPPVISSLSHGSPLFAMPMKMKLNTPRNIRVNNSQHWRMPCRISLFAWREHPHTYRFVNWVVFIPSGLLVGFYPTVKSLQNNRLCTFSHLYTILDFTRQPKILDSSLHSCTILDSSLHSCTHFLKASIC